MTIISRHFPALKKNLKGYEGISLNLSHFSVNGPVKAKKKSPLREKSKFWKFQEKSTFSKKHFFKIIFLIEKNISGKKIGYHDRCKIL